RVDPRLRQRIGVALPGIEEIDAESALLIEATKVDVILFVRERLDEVAVHVRRARRIGRAAERRGLVGLLARHAALVVRVGRALRARRPEVEAAPDDFAVVVLA